MNLCCVVKNKMELGYIMMISLFWVMSWRIIRTLCSWYLFEMFKHGILFVHRYPDATPEELSAGDNVCIICREEMTTGCKKLPCNHIFHTSCLRSWFQRQQSCPTCRLEVLRMPRPAPSPPAPQPQPQPQQAPQDQVPNPLQNSKSVNLVPILFK